jgi:hypothetical protein
MTSPFDPDLSVGRSGRLVKADVSRRVLLAVRGPRTAALIVPEVSSRQRRHPEDFTTALNGPIMSARGTNLDAPHFFGRIAAVKVVHISVLVATYGLALAFFPALSHGQDTHPYFAATYIGSIAASAFLSILALLSRPGMLLDGILVVWVYLLVVLGCSIEAFLSARLVLGIGLMTEIGILVSFPWALVAAPLAIAALALVQSVPFVLGSSVLVDVPPLPTIEGLAAYCFVLVASAAAAIYLFINQWNAYLWPLMTILTDAKKTLPIAISSMMFLTMQKQFVAGLMGSVK